MCPEGPAEVEGTRVSQPIGYIRNLDRAGTQQLAPEFKPQTIVETLRRLAGTPLEYLPEVALAHACQPGHLTHTPALTGPFVHGLNYAADQGLMWGHVPQAVGARRPAVEKIGETGRGQATLDGGCPAQG